jgi:hybrid cluster-associated redox disulfide protein
MAYGISRKSPIGELVLNAPSAAAVLLEHGFHCIGCGLAAYETVEEGAAAHGFDDAAIDSLVQELIVAAKKEEEMLNKAAGSQAAEMPKTPGKPSEAQAAKTSGALPKQAAGRKKSRKASKPG